MFLELPNRYWGNVRTYFYAHSVNELSDPDIGLWVWNDGSNGYYISENPGRPLTWDGNTLPSACLPLGIKYNGSDVYSFRISGFDGKIWNRGGGEWVISKYIGHTTGLLDRYWLSPSYSSPATTYWHRGAAETDLVVSYAPVQGWYSPSLYGEYTPVEGGGKTGNKYLGRILLPYGGGSYFKQSLPAEYLRLKPVFRSDTDGRYLWWNGTGWIISGVINTMDASVGYWTCATISGVYTRVYTGDDPPSPMTYELGSKLYSSDISNQDIYITRVATWR